MGFVINLMLSAAVKNFANRSRTDEVTAMDRVTPFFDSRCIFDCDNLSGQVIKVDKLCGQVIVVDK